MIREEIVYVPELVCAIDAAKRAGAVVRDLYERSAALSYVKHDGSPVTDADLAADRIIREALRSSYPDDVLLTEEGADDPARLDVARCWLVDPIDGTKQFVNRTGEFDVLIALIVAGRPVVGVSLQPTTGLLLSAVEGGGASIERDGASQPLRLLPAASPPRLVTSLWLGAPASMPILSRVAERLGAKPPDISELGIYTRTFVPPGNRYDALIGFGVTGTESMGWEWDVAVTDLVLHEAGGRVTDLSGQLLRYNKPSPRNTSGLVAAVDPGTHERVVAAIEPELWRRA
ncbi:MAG: 3'(2'),5'-bisphosphate nucleotidase CysQ family protein [Thermomicrobiales bacterium]